MLKADCLVGRSIQKLDASAAPNYWVLHFSEGVRLGVGSFWRLVSEQGIVICGDDHGQYFGEKAPVDAGERLLAAVGGAPVVAAPLQPRTGDLHIEFSASLRLEVLVTSCCFESWELWRPDGSALVAVGGGRLVPISRQAG